MKGLERGGDSFMFEALVSKAAGLNGLESSSNFECMVPKGGKRRHKVSRGLDGLESEANMRELAQLSSLGWS